MIDTPTLFHLALWFVNGLLAYAAVVNVMTGAVPNGAALALTGGFVGFAMACGEKAQIAPHAMVGLAALILCVILFNRGKLESGAAKLLPAIALWYGTEGIAPAVVIFLAVYGLCTLTITFICAIPGMWRGPSWFVIHEGRFPVALVAAIAVLPTEPSIVAFIPHF